MAAQVVLHFVFVVALVKTVGIAAIGQPFEFAKQRRVQGAAGNGIVNRPAINLRRARHVIGRFCAPFDLQRIDADFDQALDVLDGAQVFRVHDVGAVLVFLDRHQFAGALLLFKQPDCACRAVHVAAGIFLAGSYLVIPAAGVGAGALIRVAPVKVTGKQAAPRIGHAQGAVDKDFELDVRAFLADFGDFIER